LTKMAETIPDNFILVPGRYLIQESEAGSCLGTIVQAPPGCYDTFQEKFTTKKTITDLSDPENPEMIVIEYAHVIFFREMAQEVKIDGVDYHIIHSDNILAFIPDE